MVEFWFVRSLCWKLMTNSVQNPLDICGEWYSLIIESHSPPVLKQPFLWAFLEEIYCTIWKQNFKNTIWRASPTDPYSNKQGYKRSTLQTPKPEQEQEAIYWKNISWEIPRPPAIYLRKNTGPCIKTDFSLHIYEEKNAHSICLQHLPKFLHFACLNITFKIGRYYIWKHCCEKWKEEEKNGQSVALRNDSNFLAFL